MSEIAIVSSKRLISGAYHIWYSLDGGAPKDLLSSDPPPELFDGEQLDAEAVVYRARGLRNWGKLADRAMQIAAFEVANGLATLGAAPNTLYTNFLWALNQRSDLAFQSAWGGLKAGIDANAAALSDLGLEWTPEVEEEVNDLFLVCNFLPLVQVEEDPPASS